MKAKDAIRAAWLVSALAEIPKMRRQISGKARKPKYFDHWALELQAAEMQDGHGQGCDSYFYLEGEIALRVLKLAETEIRAELKGLGIKL